jgi:Na+/melibiose symporter-like transporter
MKDSIAKGVSNLTLILYSSGSGAMGVNGVIFGAWVLFFYNQVLGLSAVLASLAIGISLIFDAISDPLVGAWSDRLKSKLGRRHPFVYLSIFPLALGFYFLFSEPVSLDQDYLFWRLLILVVLIRISLTFYETPRAALGPELTKDYDRRNFVNAWAYAIAIFGSIILSFVMYKFFLVETEDFKGDMAFLNPEAYEYLGIFAALLIVIFGLISSLSTHRFIPELHQPQVKTTFSTKKLLEEILECFSNRSWLAMLISGCFYGLNIGISSGVGTYINKYFWQWTPDVLALFPLVTGIATIFGAILATSLAKGREKRNVCITVFSINILTSPIPYLLRLLDPYTELSLFPDNGSNLIWWILISYTAIEDMLRAMGFVLVISMIFDIVEDSQIKTGRRDEGIFMAGPGLIQKVLSGLGIFILGFVLQYIGFDPQTTNLQDENIPINQLVIFQIIIQPLLTLAATFCLFFYTISRNSHSGVVDELGYKN